ncbi:MAG: hypothetical protein ACRDHW_15370 [Ktedonobacteraceae bacterium]
MNRDDTEITVYFQRIQTSSASNEDEEDSDNEDKVINLERRRSYRSVREFMEALA